jgi:DNA-binding NarL/FixJ family response regulator
VSSRILVVEPSRIVRRGISAELAANGAYTVSDVSTGVEAIAAAKRDEPHVVLLSFKLPDRSGPEVCSAILSHRPTTAIVALSDHGDEASVRTALDAGARGYLLKDGNDLDLSRAIEQVLAGERVIDPRAAAAALLARGGGNQPKLSSQELNVVRLVADGLTNPEIGTQLHLSRHTVKEYLSHAMRKLDATNRVEVVRKATEAGLIEGPAGSQNAGSEPPTLVYRESGPSVRPSDLRVAPLKLDQLTDPDN